MWHYLQGAQSLLMSPYFKKQTQTPMKAEALSGIRDEGMSDCGTADLLRSDAVVFTVA